MKSGNDNQDPKTVKNASEVGIPEEPLTGNETISENDPTGGPDRTPAGITVFGLKLTRFRIVLMLILTVCTLLAGTGILFFRTGEVPGEPSSTDLQNPEPAAGIMRPIPVPDYREMLDFLLVYDVEGQRMITALRMEVGFQSPTRYQHYKEQNVIFRDTIYAFLLRQNLAGNSGKAWRSILEKGLLDFMRAKLPQSSPDNIALTQVENP
jgi:hypothetical protein